MYIEIDVEFFIKSRWRDQSLESIYFKIAILPYNRCFYKVPNCFKNKNINSTITYISKYRFTCTHISAQHKDRIFLCPSKLHQQIPGSWPLSCKFLIHPKNKDHNRKCKTLECVIDELYRWMSGNFTEVLIHIELLKEN